MSDHPQSTPQPPNRLDYDPAFRQTFLWRIDRPEHAETLLRFGDLLFMLFNEAHMCGSRADDRPEVVQEVEAAAADLDSLVDYLEELATRPAESVLEPDEAELCQAADGWAGRLARVVVSMKRAVAEWEAEDGEEE